MGNYYFSIAFKYIVSDQNTLCNQSDGIVINLDECKSVAKFLNFNFVRQETEALYPKGCYVFSKRIYFNTHENGASQQYSQQICKTKGIYL